MQAYKYLLLDMVLPEENKINKYFFSFKCQLLSFFKILSLIYDNNLSDQNDNLFPL